MNLKKKKGMITRILAFVATAVLFLATDVITVKADPTPNYLTFTAEEANSTVRFNYANCEGDSWSYSLDGVNWINETGKGKTFTLEHVGDTIQFRAKKIRMNPFEHFEMTGKIAASGSVTSLTDGNGGDENVALTDSCYFGMFLDCSSLTKAPELPAINLAKSCYSDMFRYCTSLTKAPELPATNLAENCYGVMFSDCTSLTEAPELPATTLAENCYNCMFSGCTSLTEAPELPATTLEKTCYRCMFSGCTSLTEAPELPATTLAESCYSDMFNNSSLTKIPELPATTLAESCYWGMFMHCDGLTEVPELPATTLADRCYYYMFAYCGRLKMWYEPKDDLTKEWKVPASSSVDPTRSMFEGCNLNAVFCLDPDLPTLATPVLNKVYYIKGSKGSDPDPGPGPGPNPGPNPTPDPQKKASNDNNNGDNRDGGRKKVDKGDSKYIDLDTNKSELPYGYVLMLNLEDMKVLQDMKVHPVDSKTNTNQQFLTQMFANQMGKKARILLTKSIHPRNPLTKEQLGVKKYLKWFHLEKKAQPIYAVCYNETDKAYYMTGTLDENGTAILRDFIARDATNITLFVLE